MLQAMWMAWKAAGAEMVELEKAQTKAIEQGRTACELFDGLLLCASASPSWSHAP
jgi:hypothetical protein